MNRYAEHRASVDGQGVAAVADWNYVLPCPLLSSALAF
jgi:hypothetical protein